MADNSLVEKPDSRLVIQDAAFVLAKTEGKSSVDALIESYPDDETVIKMVEMRNSENYKDRNYANLILRRKAHQLLQSKKIKLLKEKYLERVQSMGNTALDVLEEIMIDGSSEKVRAEVAIEMLRHNIGNPDKDAGGGTQVVVMIGSNPAQVNTEIIEGEVVNG